MRALSFAASFLCATVIVAPASAQKEISGAAASLADEIAGAGKHQLAVVDFTDLQGNVTELGRFLAEEFALGLVTSRKQITVIDRTHLRALLQEHKLASSGIIDPATARRLGEIAGVDSILTGTITPLSDSVRLVVKLLDTNTARILAASSVEIARTKTIEELMARDIRTDSSDPAGAPVRPLDQQRALEHKVIRSENKGFRIEVSECRAVQEQVACPMQFTNIGDRTQQNRLDVGGDNLVDDHGNRFAAKAIWFGTLTGPRTQRSTTMPPGVPLNVVETFEGYSPGTMTVTLVLDGFPLRSVPLIK